MLFCTISPIPVYADPAIPPWLILVWFSVSCFYLKWSLSDFWCPGMIPGWFSVSCFYLKWSLFDFRCPVSIWNDPCLISGVLEWTLFDFRCPVSIWNAWNDPCLIFGVLFSPGMIPVWFLVSCFHLEWSLIDLRGMGYIFQSVLTE